MRRLWLMLAAVAAPAACDRAAPEPHRPNVVLISIDTLRGDALNCYGSARHEISPSIDALAGDGIVFENYISAAPWTTPAHMSLITSLHPTSHGVVQTFSNLMIRMRTGKGFNRLAADRVTLAEVLAANGYATAAFTGGITLDPRIGFDQGFERYETSMYKLGESNVGSMLDWIGSRGGKPFFLFFHTFEVHAPYLEADLLPPSLREDFEAITASMSTASADAIEHMDANQRVRRFLADHGSYTPRVTAALYAGGVRSADAWVGRLLDALRQRGLYDDTLVILVSDHGDEFADHDPDAFYDMHGHTMYEELIRVPLVVKLPGDEPAGRHVKAVARGVDVMPTIVDVLELAQPPKDMQGESLRPLWEEGDTRPRVAFVEAAALPSELKCVRTDRYKYVIRIPMQSVSEHGRGFVPEQVDERLLFDLRADPGETTNLLAGDPSPDVVALADELDARLRAFATAQLAETEEVQLDEETIRRLRALGYMD